MVSKLLKAALKNQLPLWVVDLCLWTGIPFNAPHYLKLETVKKEKIVVKIPFRRSNKNHINGLHACILAAAAEYSCGLLLISHLDAKKFRIIMKNLSADYLYQAKMDSFATASISSEWIQHNVLTPLELNDSVEVTPMVEIHDRDCNKIAEVKVTWQIKPWKKVRTKK